MVTAFVQVWDGSKGLGTYPGLSTGGGLPLAGVLSCVKLFLRLRPVLAQKSFFLAGNNFITNAYWQNTVQKQQEVMHKSQHKLQRNINTTYNPLNVRKQ